MPYHIPFLTSDGKTFITSDNRQYKVIGDIFDNVDSFTITFYQSFSDPNTVAKNLGNSVTMNGTLRSGTSLVNPTILVQSGTTFAWNYAYIEAFDRYYFITDVNAVSFTMYEISMRCDVLMTYREGILAQTTRVLRSQNKHNWDYTDTLIPTKGKTTNTIIHAVRPTLGSWESLMSYPLGNTAGKGYIQVKVASDTVNGWNPYLGYSYWTLPMYGLQHLMNEIKALGVFGGSWKINEVILEAKFLPCGWIGKNSTLVSPIDQVGFRGWAGLKDEFEQAFRMNAYFYYGINSLGKIIETRWTIEQPLRSKNYMNRPPFKEMAIMFQPFGFIKIDAEKWGQSPRLYISVEADPISGNALLFISDDWVNFEETKEQIGTANIAIPIDLVTLESNMSALASALNNAISSTFSSTPSLSGALGITDVVSHSATVSAVTGSGNGDALVDYRPHLVISTVEQADPNLSTQGWYFNGDIKLSECHGFCKVDAGVHLDSQGFGFATEPEIREIETLLTSGVVLP